jgi:hypothetical protein
LFRTRVGSPGDGDGGEDDSVESPSRVYMAIIHLFEEAREVVWVFGCPSEEADEEARGGDDHDPRFLAAREWGGVGDIVSTEMWVLTLPA